MTLPSVADLLSIPELAAGEPKVVAGSLHLGNAVRWVHISESDDIAPWLSGGELILTGGTLLPVTATKLRAYIESLARARVAGLVIELGRFQEIPEALLRTADGIGMPVIVLAEKVRFVKVT
jgi:purine catabolism regulator